MVKAMLKTGNSPDYIVVDGAGSARARPRLNLPIISACLSARACCSHNTLVGAGIRQNQGWRCRQDRQRLRYRHRHGARRRLDQRGAGFMFAIGCIQSLSWPHKRVSDRGRDAGSDAAACALSATRPTAFIIFTQYVVGAVRDDRCPRTRSPHPTVRTILSAASALPKSAVLALPSSWRTENC